MEEQYMSNNMKILQMDISLNSENYSMDLSNDMLINVANINESYQDQPSKFAWWATLATLARSKANKLKQQLDREQDYIKTTLTGTLDSKVRQQLELDGEKITETKVTNAIYTHPEYISHKEKVAQFQEEYLEADEQARLLEMGKETMNQRKEMLISLGAQLRNDWDGVGDFASHSSEDDEKDSKVHSIVGSKKSGRTGMKRTPVVTENTESEE